jgi:hypothetical protein
MCVLLFSGLAGAEELSVDQIVQRLTVAQSRNHADERPYISSRSYRVTKAGTERAAMTAIMRRPAPAEMSFQIVDSTGGVPEKAVRKSLEKEVEIIREPSISEVTARNYRFEWLGRERMNGVDCYVLKVIPRERTKDLIDGRIWIDAQTFLIRRMEGKPAKSPSWWIKDLDLQLTFGEVLGVWVQLRSEVTLHIRFAGEYVVQAQNTSVALLDHPLDIAKKQRLFRRYTPTGAYVADAPSARR